MKISIERVEGVIGVIKDYGDIDDKGEIAQFLVELEIIKLDLLDLWEQATDPNNIQEP